MDWNDLESKIYTLSKKAFSNFLDVYSHESFYAFALYTDSSAMTVCLAANSLEKLGEKLDKEEEADKTDDVVSYFKWTSSEWAYEAFEGDAFADLNHALRSDNERDEFDTFRQRLIQSMINALGSLAKEDFFKKEYRAGDLIVFVTITDDDAAESIENESARLLNTENRAETFLKRFES